MGIFSPKKIKDKKILMIIAHKKFRDEELLHTREEILKEGGKVKVASTAKTLAKGMLGATYKPDLLMSQVNVSEFDAVVFIGGGGAEIYFNDAKAHQIARDAYGQGKVLGAICIAPSILALAGLLKGRRATVFSGGKYVNILKDNGAMYTGEALSVDGNIVTANGPNAARRFGEAIVQMLSG